ncbi:23S rRNA (uracil(1939)-C(5))-methyltransferase RlmD [candidate division KSB1 bacterium]
MNDSDRVRLSKDTQYETDITDLAVGGKGIARISGKIVFVEKALPGQRVSIQVYKDRKDYAEARVVEVIVNSPLYTEPLCPHFTFCGGCSVQNMSYADQIKYKKQWIEESLLKIGKLHDVKVCDTVASPETMFYRNKMEFSFSQKVLDPETRKIQSGSHGLGLHLPGRYDTVLNIEKCVLQSEKSQNIVNFVREFAQKSTFSAYDIQKQNGFWRYLIIREGKADGSTLVNIITASSPENGHTLIDELSTELLDKVGDITAVLHAEYSGKSQAANWDRIRTVYGKNYIEETIGSALFRIESRTFFQTNTQQVGNLYGLVKKYGAFNGSETVYDLYSGIGTIPVFLSGSVKKVVGFELDPSSVESARENVKRNGIKNCHFMQGKVRSLIKYPNTLFKKYGRPHAVITDPPRSGMDAKTIERVIRLGAQKVIYVSCNPSTLARDLSLLSERYRIVEVTPVDMFPHTSHIESVVLLVREDT